MNQDIINYIKEGRQHGMADIEIKQNLLNVGWDAGSVEESFAHLKAQESRTPVNKDEDIKAEAPPTAGPNLNFHMASHMPENQPQQKFQPALNSSLPPGAVPKSGSRFGKIVGLAIAGIVLLGGAGAAAYFFVYQSPERVWKKFSLASQEDIFSGNLKVTYKDSGELASEDLVGTALKDISLDVTSKVYSDVKAQIPQSSAEMSYSFSSGNTSFSTGFEYRLIGKKLYMNVGDNPFLGNMFTQMTGGKKISWVVLDLEELEKKANEQNPEKANEIRQVFNDQLFGEVKKTWDDATFVKMEKYLGREKINGKTTLHFANTLDKQAIKNTVNNIVDRLIKATRDSGQEVKDEDANTIKTTVSALVDKLEVKQFETWIGATDFKIYKVSIKISAPSVISAVKTLMDGPKESSRDARRLADVRQMASALEIYFDTNNRYPASQDGRPAGLESILGQIPDAPTPADGNCTDYYNTYWYEAPSAGNTYSLTFCLGSGVGGYVSGIKKLSPRGIEDVSSCPSTPGNCYKSGSATATSGVETNSTEDKIKSTVEKIDFSATLDIGADYSDYGVKKEVQAPEGAFDLMELLTGTGQAALN